MTSLKIKFVKLWDFSGYRERTTSKRLTCQKLAFQGKEIIFEILAQLWSNKSMQILLNFTQFITLGTESNLEGFVRNHQSKMGLVSPKTICPTMLVFGR